MTLKFNRVRAIVKVYMFMQNFIKLSAAVHELSYAQTILPYLAMVKNPKIRSCDLDLEILWVSSGSQGTHGHREKTLTKTILWVDTEDSN